MAASRVMASASSATSNISRQNSLYSIKSLTSMNIDDLFRNIESDGLGESPISRQGSINKVEWSEVGNDNGGGGGGGGEMTLEDFLDRAEMDDGVGVPERRGRKREGGGGFSVDPVEKAALQRHKRMIKNRESAARSRERKQAYTAELESLVAQLEEENAQLLRQQDEQNKKRLKELAENLVVVTKQRKPLRPLRRIQSSEW